MPTIAVNEGLSAEVLALPVTGRHLAPGGTFGDQLDAPQTLLVFLRHLGCIFCRESVADLRAQASTRGMYPAILFVHKGTEADVEAFFTKADPDSRVIADEKGQIYDAFGVGRGTVGQLFAPEVWACGFRAMKKGHFNGLPVGDPWQLPGFYLIEDRRVIWKHEARHAGDHPDFSRIGEDR